MDKILLSLVLGFISFFATAQTLNQGIKSNVLSELMGLIQKQYVDESNVWRIVDSLRFQQYPEDRPVEFARHLTRDLQRFSKDKHFEISYQEEADSANSNESKSSSDNYGFAKLEVLKGNVGYLKIGYFESPKLAGGLLHSAMNFLVNTDALIIDLRDNTGGRKAMVQLLLSYLFEEESRHIYTIYGRNELFYGYTEIDLPGRRMPEKPLYVLVNQRSFSAAEMLAFVVQMQDRGMVIGSKTAGGGHSVGNYPIGHGFYVNLPVGKVVDPGTQKGWEKSGVQPDLETSPGDCLSKAHLKALEDLLKKDNYHADPFEIYWQMDILRSELEPTRIEDIQLQSYKGVYGRRIVSYVAGNLFYQGRAGIEKARMIPINETTFRFDEVDFFRVQFVHNEQGQVTGLRGLYDDGYEDYSVRVQ